ncbi:MAG: HAMP domain-containing sensor histidine kinase [Cyclobacteriaceae bacterium]
MTRNQPELSKPTTVIRQDRYDNKEAQETWEQYLMQRLPAIASISWKLDEDQAYVQFYAGHVPRFITLPLRHIYWTFQNKDNRFQKSILWLESGEIQRLETVFQIDNRGEEKTIQMEARMDHHSDGGKIILTFSKEGNYAESAMQALGFDNIPVGVFYVESQTGSIMAANAKALDLVGMQQDEDLTNIRWQRAPEWLSFIQEVNQQGDVLNQVLEILAGKVWFLFSAHRTDDHIVVFAQDISTLQLQIQTLQKVNIGLDNFVYHASHDLRAPLRSMQGLITLLRTETNEKERDKFVELIEGSIKRLDAFLVDLLSISRSNRPERRPLVKMNFMLEVEKAIGSFFHIGNNKNLEVSTRISQPVPFVSDLTQVRVILNNIISNAFKYRRYGVRKSRIKIEISTNRKRAHIKISDNGEGIAEEHLPHIFEMFYRATDRSEGSGLGLYIVRETVEKLKGTINLKSQPNHGTTFTIMLPNQFQPTKKA